MEEEKRVNAASFVPETPNEASAAPFSDFGSSGADEAARRRQAMEAAGRALEEERRQQLAAARAKEAAEAHEEEQALQRRRVEGTLSQTATGSEQHFLQKLGTDVVENARTSAMGRRR